MSDSSESPYITPDNILQALGVTKVPDSSDLKVKLLAAISLAAKGVAAKFHADAAETTEACVTRALSSPKTDASEVSVTIDDLSAFEANFREHIEQETKKLAATLLSTTKSLTEEDEKSEEKKEDGEGTKAKKSEEPPAKKKKDDSDSEGGDGGKTDDSDDKKKKKKKDESDSDKDDDSDEGESDSDKKKKKKKKDDSDSDEDKDDSSEDDSGSDKKKKKKKKKDESDSEGSSSSDKKSKGKLLSAGKYKPTKVAYSWKKSIASFITVTKNVAKWTSRSDTMIVLDKPIKTGVWHFDFVLKGGHGGSWTPVCGASIHPYSVSLTSCFGHIANTCSFYSGGTVYCNNRSMGGNSKWDDGVLVGMEADMKKKTLCFFVEKKQQPVYVTDLPTSIQLAVGAGNVGATCTIIQLKKLSKATFKKSPGEKTIKWA